MNIKACKLFLSLIILYSGYYLAFFSPIPNMMYILGGIMLVFLFMSVITTSVPLSSFINSEIILWLLFGFSSFIFAHYIAYNAAYSDVAIFNFFENLALIITICYICKHDSNCSFITSLYFFYALLFATTIIFSGYSFTQRSSFTNMGSNGIGMCMSIGIFCTLYKLDFKKIFKSIFFILSIFIFIFIIVLSGSRKALFVSVLCIVYWSLFSSKKYLKVISSYKKIIIVIIIIALVSIVAIKFTPLFLQSNMFSRLVGYDTAATGGDEIRKGMYSEAMYYFRQNPVFGIGYKNYELISVYQTYSHSTYAELLACTGIVGFLLYTLPYILTLKKIIHIITDKNLSIEFKIKGKFIFISLISMIFLGFGVIHFYEIQSSIMFGCIFGFTLINSKPWRKKKNE